MYLKCPNIYGIHIHVSPSQKLPIWDNILILRKRRPPLASYKVPLIYIVIGGSLTG